MTGFEEFSSREETLWVVLLSVARRVHLGMVVPSESEPAVPAIAAGCKGCKRNVVLDLQ